MSNFKTLLEDSLKFVNYIYYIKPLFSDNKIYKDILDKYCEICKNLSCIMYILDCCNIIICNYCNIDNHNCKNININNKPIKKISLNTYDKHIRILELSKYSCCYNMSGCRDQLSYNKAKEHVENCNYKYYISDDKILLTNCDSSKNINLPFIDTLFISNYINKYSFNKVQGKKSLLLLIFYL